MADKKPVTWPDLLIEYGLEKVRVQVLSPSLEGQQTTRQKDNTTRFSFRSEITLGEVMSDRTEGFIFWLDKDEVRAARDRCAARLDSMTEISVREASHD